MHFSITHGQPTPHEALISNPPLKIMRTFFSPHRQTSHRATFPPTTKPRLTLARWPHTGTLPITQEGLARAGLTQGGLTPTCHMPREANMQSNTSEPLEPNMTNTMKNNIKVKQNTTHQLINDKAHKKKAWFLTCQRKPKYNPTQTRHWFLKEPTANLTSN